jgi:hypothetical protein
MDLQQLAKLQQAATSFLGNWWQDDRRNWCAYCGIPTRKRAPRGAPHPPTLATRDHVIPKAHRGGLLTIPSCKACNASKGTLSVPEYLESENFKMRRQAKHKNQWPEYTLWAVAGVAALKRASAMASTTAVPKPKKALAAKAPAPTADRIR